MRPFLRWLLITLILGGLVGIVLIMLFPRDSDTERLAERLETAPFELYLPELSGLRPMSVGGRADLLDQDGPLQTVSVLYARDGRVELPLQLTSAPTGSLCRSTDIALPDDARCQTRAGVVRASYPGYVGRGTVRDGTLLWVLLPAGEGPVPAAIERALRDAPRVTAAELAGVDQRSE